MSHRATPMRRRLQRAYTVVEVMMALAVLGIGGAGVVAMQRTTVLGNVRARDLATANAVAAKWAERLQTDGLLWQVATTGQSSITDTTHGPRWLRAVGGSFPTTDTATGEGQWLRPAPDTTGDLVISPQADVRGNDTFKDGDAAFCTHLRMRQILPNLIRAEIRVFWLRHGVSAPSGVLDHPLCDATQAYVDAVGTAPERFHFVYLATSVLRQGS